MKFILRAYRYLNLLSIDVAAGASISAAFFAQLLNVKLFLQAYAALGLTVWIIYTSDHLLDAYVLDKPASTPRHLFHQKYFRVLAAIVGVAILADVVLVLMIRAQLMVPGIIVSIICSAYLVFSRWLRYVKEVVATLLYSAGVLLPALSLNHSPTVDEQQVIAQFVLIVLINILLFARMSYVSDLSDKQQSIFTTIGPRAGNWLITVVFIFLAVLMLAPSGTDVWIKVVMAAMGLTLLMIFLFPAFFGSEERYRLVGDFVFILPGVLLWSQS